MTPEDYEAQVNRLSAALQAIRSQKKDGVLSEVAEERRRQDQKWGEQNHPDTDWFSSQAQCVDLDLPFECDIKELNADAVVEGKLTWVHILAEEFAEAAAAACDKPVAELRKELIQVAAVAVAWVECIDRKNGK